MEAVLSLAEPVAIAVTDSSHVSAARYAVQRVARGCEFDETRTARASIVATEAATNLLKHAGGGTFVARRLERGEALGIELLAIDAGPGMRDVDASLRDGMSTAGTPGTGLGAMRRQSDEFDLYTQPGAGTVVRLVLWNRPPPVVDEDYEVGAVVVPKPGETACGDAWVFASGAAGGTLLVADGLGHGPEASRAAQSAADVMARYVDQPAIRILDLAHGRLRATRGAAVAVMRHQPGAEELEFSGVGNIAAVILEGTSRRATVSHNGIVGHNIHKSEPFRYRWPVGALLVAHSDGLESQWDLAAFPGAMTQHPSIVAALLFRRHWRKRDDVAVVVARRLR